MGLVLSTKNLILKELLLMTTTKHEGLRAWAKYARRANDRGEKRFHTLRKNKRVIRILIIQTDLGAEL